MAVIFWWMAFVWLALVLLAIALAVRIGRRGREQRDPVLVAHSERLTGLPAFRAAAARYRGVLIGSAVAVLVALVATTALTMRFATAEVKRTDLANRDIVLCLDVSGSMIDYDSRVVDVFGDLAEEFEGERLSLVVFNASAVTYFPLTSDLDYIERQFARIQDAFESPDEDLYSGTLFGNGSSLVGDGLASCVLRFDQAQDERSRSIIFVSDNVVAGEPVYTLPQAGELAQSRGVRVYGINPGDTAAKGYLSELADELEAVVRDTGGGYYALEDAGTIPAIVSSITAQQAALTRGPAYLTYEEQPALATLLLGLALLAVLVLAWRLRR
jgi:hypothetical protein